jgi:pimeloyl-ACP methyl ester carboxylesterase
VSIEKCSFMIDNQWNIIHLPVKPNGFGVMIIGDCNHYVDQESSLWKQNKERAIFIQSLKELGYTVFYSNLYGRHWGSPKAVLLAKRLYHYVMKHEILNPNIHLIAEGMGALVALQLMVELEDHIRSALLINPCLDLPFHFNHERQNRLFYKRLVREISQAYNVSNNEVCALIERLPSVKDFNVTTPVSIWHAAGGVAFSSKDHSRVYEKRRREMNSPILLSIQIPEYPFNPAKTFTDFFSQNEKIL